LRGLLARPGEEGVGVSAPPETSPARDLPSSAGQGDAAIGGSGERGVRSQMIVVALQRLIERRNVPRFQRAQLESRREKARREGRRRHLAKLAETGSVGFLAATFFPVADLQRLSTVFSISGMKCVRGLSSN
jgi:hypothetical protein